MLNDNNLLKRIEDRIEIDKDNKNKDMAESELNLAFYFGDQWTKAMPISNGVEITNIDNPSGNIRYIINYIRPTIHTIMAKITAPNPIIKVLPKTGNTADINAARISEYVLESEMWDNFNMPLLLQKIVPLLACGGSVILHPYFNPNIGKKYSKDEINALFGEEIWKEDMHEGRVELDILTRYEIYADPYAENDTEARWYIIEKVRDKDWVEEVYGKKLKNITKINMPYYYNKFSNIANIKNDNKIIIRELWEKPSKEYPNGLIVIATDNEIIKVIEQLPYGFDELNLLPFVKIDYETILGRFWGIPPVSAARYPQRLINRTYTQYMNHITAYTHAPLLNPVGNMVKKTHFNFSKPLNFINYAPGLNDSGRPSFLQPPPINPQILDNINLMKRYIEDLFGVHEISKATAPAGVKTGRALSILDAADDTKIHPVVIQIEKAMSKLGQMVLQIIEKTYQIPRIIKMVGQHNQSMVADFTGDKIGGNKDVIVKLRTPIPMNKMAAIDTVLAFWDRGIIEKTKEGLKLAHKMLEMEAFQPMFEGTKDEEQARYENAILDTGYLGELQPVYSLDDKGQPKLNENGQPVIIGTQYLGLPRNDWDIDEIHIQIHEDRQKEITYLEMIQKNPRIHEAYNMHKNQHREALLKKQELMMQEQLRSQQMIMQADLQQKTLNEQMKSEISKNLTKFKEELRKDIEIELSLAKAEIAALYNENNNGI